MNTADFIGIPYVCLGRTPRGVDCWGLVLLVQKRMFGRILPSYEIYEDSEYPGRAIADSWPSFDVIERGNEQPGDVLTFRGPRTDAEIHCGIVVRPGVFLHSLAGRDSCLERYDQGIWNKFLVGIGRWKS